MEALALFGIIILIVLVILLFVGYGYIFDVIVNMKNSGGEPYLRVDTNLQPI